MRRRLSGEKLNDLQIENDQQLLRQTLEGLPGWARSSAERDEEFWRRQRSSVWTRISAAENQGTSRPPIVAWALAAVMVAGAAWLLERPTVVPPHEAQVDPDHELLMEVERMVQIDGPLALEPAGLLAQEMVQDLAVGNSPIRKKERRDEN
jgi:hypothetical protein